MEWLNRWNEALEYLEGHLDQKVDYEEMGRRACCSAYHFQRMFSYLAGIPLSEYICRRRMTLAAMDLQQGDKVMDVALRYGYESPTAFNRAFQAVHGMAPSAAQQEGAMVKAYPKISFKITIKGEAEMEYRIVKREAFRIVGISAPLENDIEKNFQVVPTMWGKAVQSGALETLVKQMDGEPKGVLGVSACSGQDQWAYWIAVASNAPVPDGMEETTIPAATWAVFPGTGPMPGAIADIERRVVTEWLPGSGYEYADAPDVEVYLDANPENARFEVWIPVVKK